MPKVYRTKHVLKVLQREGFCMVSQKGSHVKFRKVGSPTLNTIVPLGKKEIPCGTFRAILLQTKLEGGVFDGG